MPLFDYINRDDSAEILGYGHALMSAFQFADGFAYYSHRKPSNEFGLALIQDSAKKWVRHCELKYTNFTEKDLLEIAGLYEFVYSIAKGGKPDSDIMDKMLTRYFNAWLRGYPGISDMDVMRYLVSEQRKYGANMKKSLLSSMQRIERPWIESFRNLGYFKTDNLASSIRIAGLLLRRDLSSYSFDEIDFKQRIVDRFLPQTNLLEGRDSRTLQAIHYFSQNLNPKYMDYNSNLKLHVRICELLSENPDINHLARIGYRLDALYHQALLDED